MTTDLEKVALEMRAALETTSKMLNIAVDALENIALGNEPAAAKIAEKAGDDMVALIPPDADVPL